MSKPRVFEKPLGMRDLLPETVLYKKIIEEKIRSCFQRWGYKEIVTPTLEFFDTIGEASLIDENRLFKLLDRYGNTLVLRPDMTAPIARVVSSLMKNEMLPIRLCYHGSVFRAQEREAGRHAELFQSGVELINEQSIESDAEIIALALECLNEAKVKDSKITVGSMAFVNYYLTDIIQNEWIEAQFKEYLLKRDYVGYRSFIASLTMSNEKKEALLELLQLHGGYEQLEAVFQTLKSEEAKQSIHDLIDVWNTLKDYGVERQVVIDLSLVSTIHYYTGVIFEGYTSKLGFPICSGGRYDDLTEQFGRKTPATGFALFIDRIMEASSLDKGIPLQKVLVRYEHSYRREALEYAKKRRIEKQTSVVTAIIDEHNDIVGCNWDEVVTFSKEEKR